MGGQNNDEKHTKMQKVIHCDKTVIYNLHNYILERYSAVTYCVVVTKQNVSIYMHRLLSHYGQGFDQVKSHLFVSDPTVHIDKISAMKTIK